MSLRSYISDNRWPLGIILFFLLLAVFNVFLFVTAMQGRPGRVTDTPYQDSLAYEEVLVRERLGLRLGVTLDCRIGEVETEEIRSINCDLTGSQAPAKLALNKTAYIDAQFQFAGSKEAAVQTKLGRSGSGELLFSGYAELGHAGIWFIRYDFNSQQGPIVVRERRVLSQ